MLRLPATHIRSLICFASGVHAILLSSCLATCAPRRSESLPSRGQLFNRRPDLPVCLHVDVNGTSQVPRRSIPCLCPALRPRPNRRSLAYRRSHRYCPHASHGEGFSAYEFRGSITRLWHLLPTLQERCCHHRMQGSLPAGWLSLYREGVEPSGPLQKVADNSLILLFWIYPGAREVSVSS